MPFRGDLQEFPLFDVLQMVATTGKSGRLVLTRRRGRGLVVFRDGRIVYAASESLRETLGSLLVSLELLDEDRLREGLEIQSGREPKPCLGAVLVEKGWLTDEEVEHAVTQQVERVIAELGSWREGFFEFTQMAVPSRGEVTVSARDLLLEHGLSADRVLLSIAVQLDEAGRDETGDRERDPDESRLFDLAGLASGSPDASSSDPRIAVLKEILTRVRSPKLTGETIELLLSSAAEHCRRVVLFAVHSDFFRGLAQRGFDTARMGRVGDLRLPVAATGILRRATATREVVRATLGSDEGDELLAGALGGAPPGEVIAAPLAVGEKVGLVVYGDNSPANEAIGPTDELELILLQAGLAIERAALLERVEELEFDQVLKSRG